jgi:hypothetical protein
MSTQAGPHTWLDRIKQQLWAFGVPWSPGFVLGMPPRGGFQKWSKWPWDMIHSMPCRNPCRLYIHLAFTYFVGASRVVWSELGPVAPFPPMRVLEVQWSRPLKLVCEVALRVAFHLEAGPILLEADCMKLQPILGWRPASTTHYDKIMPGANFSTCKGLRAKKPDRFNESSIIQ